MLFPFFSFSSFFYFFAEYKDDQQLIPKNTSVIVRRVPLRFFFLFFDGDFSLSKERRVFGSDQFIFLLFLIPGNKTFFPFLFFFFLLPFPFLPHLVFLFLVSSPFLFPPLPSSSLFPLLFSSFLTLTHHFSAPAMGMMQSGIEGTTGGFEIQQSNLSSQSNESDRMDSIINQGGGLWFTGSRSFSLFL